MPGGWGNDMRGSTILVVLLSVGVVGAGAWFFFFRGPANQAAPQTPTLGPPWLGGLMAGLGQSLPDIARTGSQAMTFFQGLSARKE